MIILQLILKNSVIWCENKCKGHNSAGIIHRTCWLYNWCCIRHQYNRTHHTPWNSWGWHIVICILGVGASIHTLITLHRTGGICQNIRGWCCDLFRDLYDLTILTARLWVLWKWEFISLGKCMIVQITGPNCKFGAVGVEFLAGGARGPGSNPGLAFCISEIGYLLLPSRNMTERL